MTSVLHVAVSGTDNADGSAERPFPTINLAAAVAHELGAPLYEWYVKSTSRAQDGLYTLDVLRRLQDAQMRDPKAQKLTPYLRFGPLGAVPTSLHPHRGGERTCGNEYDPQRNDGDQGSQGRIAPTPASRSLQQPHGPRLDRFAP